MQLSRQAALVRDHLYAYPHLTSWQAEGVYRIRRLASRISELKHAGFEIKKETARDATGQLYTRYAFSPRQLRSEKPVLSPIKPSFRVNERQLRRLYSRYCRDELFIDGASLDAEVNAFITFLKEHA